MNFTSRQQQPENDREILTKVTPCIALIGIVGHPAFYFICNDLGYYDNAILRLLGSALFLPFLLLKKKTSAVFLFYSELVYVFSLPFLFSFFLYANNQNLYWKLSLLFAGGAYGMLSYKASTSLILMPLSCIVSFVLVNFYLHTNTVSGFYESLPTLLSSWGCAVVLIFVKNALKLLMLRSIRMTDDHKRLAKRQKYLEMEQKNLELQNNIFTAQRLKVLADLSHGISVEIENTLNIIKDSVTRIDSKVTDTNRKNKTQTVIKIVENAAASLSKRLHH